jgi:hypothetical protein
VAGVTLPSAGKPLLPDLRVFPIYLSPSLPPSYPAHPAPEIFRCGPMRFPDGLHLLLGRIGVLIDSDSDSDPDPDLVSPSTFSIEPRRASRRGRGGVSNLVTGVSRGPYLFKKYRFPQAKAVAGVTLPSAGKPLLPDLRVFPIYLSPSLPPSYPAHPAPEIFRCGPMRFPDGLHLLLGRIGVLIDSDSDSDPDPDLVSPSTFRIEPRRASRRGRGGISDLVTGVSRVDALIPTFLENFG